MHMSKKSDRDIVIKPSHKRLPHTDARGIPYNEMGNAERFVDRSEENENENALTLKPKKKN